MNEKLILFNIVYFLVIFLAEFIWSGYLIFIVLKIIRKNELIFKRNFFLFILYSAILSLAVSWGFDYTVNNIETVQGIWYGLGRLQKIGLLLVPTFILMYVYFYLTSVLFKLKANQTLLLVLVLGLANSPWRIFLS